MQIDRSKCIFVELDQNATHVVATQLLLRGVLTQKTIQHFLKHLLWTLPTHPILPHFRYQVLTIFLVSFPNTVAAHQNKVVVLAKFHCFYIRVARNRLPVILKIRIFLVIEIS